MSPLAEVVAVTPEISEFRKRFPGRCRVITNGVPLPSLEPSMRARGRALLGAKQDSFVVGCAARLVPREEPRRPSRSICTAARDEPRSLLACAGDGPLARCASCRGATRAGVSEHVRWLGSVEDMSQFYSALDVCVLNSTREGLPLCLLEAMSFGIPVVATDVGGVGELIAGGAGVLVPPQAPQVLAGALRSLATAARAGERARPRRKCPNSRELQHRPDGRSLRRALPRGREKVVHPGRRGVCAVRISHVIAPGLMAGAENVVLQGCAALLAGGHELCSPGHRGQTLPSIRGEVPRRPRERGASRSSPCEVRGRLDLGAVMKLRAAFKAQRRGGRSRAWVQGARLRHAGAEPRSWPSWSRTMAKPVTIALARFYERLARTLYGQVDCVFAVSSATTESLVAAGVRRAKLRTVPNPVSLPAPSSEAESQVRPKAQATVRGPAQRRKRARCSAPSARIARAHRSS